MKKKDIDKCPEFLTSESFDAVFERASSCPQHEDIELVYKNCESSGDSSKIYAVDMTVYIRFDTGKECSEYYKIYRYEKKQDVEKV